MICINIYGLYYCKCGENWDGKFCEIGNEISYIVYIFFEFYFDVFYLLCFEFIWLFYFKIYLLFLDLCDIKLVELIIVVDIILSILEEVF